MDFGLSDEQQMVVGTVRSFVENELYPLEAEIERSGECPIELGRAIQRKVIELGFYAPNIPEEFGGGGLDHLTFTLLERELGRASMALRSGGAGPRTSSAPAMASSASAISCLACAATRSTPSP